jgi:hypothetical protein
MKKHAAPILAAILLLLPMLYVGSYLALVTPNGRVVFYVVGPNTSRGELVHYRWGDDEPSRFFWPLEQLDRKLRPGAWEFKYGAGSYNSP